MSFGLQVSFILGLVLLFILIVYFIRRKALSLKYTLLWIFSVFVMFILSLFPGILTHIANLFGFQVESNAVFSLVLGFIIAILLSITSIVSRQTERIKILVQTNALLENRIRNLENFIWNNVKSSND
jgi:hypothetical protein